MAQKQSITQQFAGGEGAGSSWRLFTFLFITFLIMVFSYTGLRYGYTAFLEGSIAELDNEIELSAANLELSEQKDLIVFYSQMVNLSDLLDKHIFGSKVFPFLESTTGTRVSYSTIGLSIPDKEIIIDGLAGSFETLVQQLFFWQESPDVERVVLEENSFANDMIRFRARIIFVPDFFLFSENYVGFLETPSDSAVEEGTQ